MSRLIAALAPIFKALFEALLPFLAGAAKDTAEDGAPVGAREKRLRAKMKKDGWK